MLWLAQNKHTASNRGDSNQLCLLNKERMKMKLRTIALFSSALVSALILAGCAVTDSGPAVPSPTSTASVEASAAFSAADSKFATGMIPHHQQAVEMVDVVLAKDCIDDRVIKLALQIKAAQDPEIETMKGWLADWGVTHKDSGMDGMANLDHGDDMMSQSDMDQLDRVEGVEASRLFLEQMIVHHTGAITMAQTEITRGKNPAAVSLAGSVVSGQEAEIVTMKDILGTI